jgi:hypothetical protein
MSCWEPHIDLMRLLEALGREIIAATELEVRQACTEEKGRSIAARRSAIAVIWRGPALQVQGGSSAVRTANEVRELIEAVSGDPSDPFDVEKGYIEVRGSRHIQGQRVLQTAPLPDQPNSISKPFRRAALRALILRGF